MTQTHDAFLLTSESRDHNGKHELVYFGNAPTLGPVKLVFDQSQPVFFIERDEKLPAVDCRFERKPLKLKSFSDKDIDGLYFKTRQDQVIAADRFKATGVRHFEGDVRPEDRFLMERFINGGVRFMGAPEERREGITVFRNPKLKPASVPFQPLIVSLDIETGVASGRLYSIGIHLSGKGRDERRVFMLADERRDMPENLALYPSEKAVLSAFLEWFKQADPDIIIGWHVIGFDLMFMDRKCRDLGLTLDLARDGGRVALLEKPGMGYFADISGRVVIDGPQTLRGAAWRFANYKLETVAQDVLNTGKLITPNQDKIAEIERQFRDDKPALARYNLEDCVLVTQIYDKLAIMELIYHRSSLSGLLPESQGMIGAAFDHFFLPRLHRKGLVAPNPNLSRIREEDVPKTDGDARHIKPGLYDNVVTLDLGNTLPALLCMFKIGPLALLRNKVNPLTMLSGFAFSQTEQLLPAHMEKLLDMKHQANLSPIHERALDIYTNTLCKALAAPKGRYHNDLLAAALVQAERRLVEQSLSFCLAKDLELIYADAQSLFIRLDPHTSAAEILPKLAAEYNEWWRNLLKLEDGFSLTAAPGRIFKRVAVLDATARAAQRFAAIEVNKGRENLTHSGLDSLIPNWTPLGRDFLEAFLPRFLNNDGFEKWAPQFGDRVRGGEFDSPALTYTKKLAKRPDEYGKNPPPHIRAALLLDKPGKTINYIWSKSGPIPVEHQGEPDYDYYVQKQVQAVADPFLALVDKSFDRLTVPEQISLF